MRNKYIKMLVMLIVYFLFFTTTLPIYASVTPRPTAINGILDLTEWDWPQDGALPLNGEWEFYWHALYTPEEFKEENLIAGKELILLPRAWNNYTLGPKKLSGRGYATYRLLIYHNSEEILGIRIPRIFTSYRLWADGQLLASAGQVGADAEQMLPQYLPQTKYFRPKTNSLELIVEVANFRHRSGGILEIPQIGPASKINELQVRNLALELFLFGSLFIIGCYHLALFIFRTKDRSTLYFGIFSLLISARTLLVGEIFFIHLFPSFSWEIAHKMQTLAYYLGTPLVVLFLKATFPQDISRSINLFIQTFGIGSGLLVLCTPARVFTYVNPVYQVFSLFVIIYIIYIAVLACCKKREGSYLIGLGLLTLIIFSLNDIIFLSVILADSNNHFLRKIVTRGDLSSWGLLVFVFTQSIVLAKKFSKSFSRVESLTERLQDVNANLEGKVKARTLALETSKEELKEAYHAVSRSQKSLQDLMQNISHDLRTPLSAVKGYIDVILDGIVKEPLQKEKYLTRAKDQVNHINQMVQELFELSQLQSRQVKLQSVPISLKSFIETNSHKYSLDLFNRQNIRSFKLNYPPGWPDNPEEFNNLLITVDPEKIERVLTNLLSNALKYTDDGDQIELSFALTEDRGQLLIKVSDTGIGISSQDLPHVFDRFYMASPSRKTAKSGSGLGLAIVKEIIEYHKGRIWVESTPGRGSQFCFTLPVYNYDESNTASI